MKNMDMEKIAARMLALMEQQKPEPEHECTQCKKMHSVSSRSEPWHCFTLDAIRAKSDDYAVLSKLIDNAPDMDAGFQWLAETLEAIKEGSISDEDSISEWADSMTPVYTYNLLQWFAQGTNRLELISESAAEYDTDNSAGGGAMLMRSYYYGLQQFAWKVWYALENNITNNE